MNFMKRCQRLVILMGMERRRRGLYIFFAVFSDEKMKRKRGFS